MLSSEELMGFVATSDAARSKTFYADLLGLRLIADEPYALVFDANGSMLRIQKVAEFAPAAYTALGWQVNDIAQLVAELRDKGISFERYPHLPQDASGIWTTPDGAKVAWFKDPCGNLLSLTQF